MNVLVAGCGYVGTSLGLRLAAAGHTVWGLRRDPSGLPASIRPVPADLAQPSALTALPAGLDAVVYAASAGGFDDASYRAAYVEGPAHLLAALEAQGHRVRRVVFVSSTGVYAQQDGSFVDENAPCEAKDFSAMRLLQGERLLRAGPYPATVLRLGGIYGPGRTRLIDDIAAGRATIASGPPRYANRIHRDDAAGAIAHLLSIGEPADLYLGVDDDPADEADVIRWLAARLGVPVPPVAPGAAAPPGRRGNKRCLNARLRAAGYAFVYPTFREGYGALLRP